jgi:5-methyltetrahydrofolate--homocysteine methyltransferase
MAGIPGLTIIGESINDSVPSTHELFDRGDLQGILALARKQAEEGAHYLDVNIGPRSPQLMAEVVKAIQEVVSIPLVIDSPDPEIAAAGLRAYDPSKAGGRKPILNSISLGRLGMLELLAIQPCRVILLVSEKSGEGGSVFCRSAEGCYQVARELVERVRQTGFPLSNDDLIIDPGITPLASDTAGHLGRVLETIRRIHEDKDLAGIHFVVGLSNLTVMLPSKRADGSPVKGPLQNAFLTKAVPLGLDMVVATTGRKYQFLCPDHPAMKCLEDCLANPGMQAVLRIRKFYSSAS